MALGVEIYHTKSTTPGAKVVLFGFTGAGAGAPTNDADIIGASAVRQGAGLYRITIAGTGTLANLKPVSHGFLNAGASQQFMNGTFEGVDLTNRTIDLRVHDEADLEHDLTTDQSAFGQLLVVESP